MHSSSSLLKYFTAALTYIFNEEWSNYIMSVRFPWAALSVSQGTFLSFSPLLSLSLAAYFLFQNVEKPLQRKDFSVVYLKDFTPSLLMIMSCVVEKVSLFSVTMFVLNYNSFCISLCHQANLDLQELFCIFLCLGFI